MVQKYDDDEQLIDVQVPVVSGKLFFNSISSYIISNYLHVEIIHFSYIRITITPLKTDVKFSIYAINYSNLRQSNF